MTIVNQVWVRDFGLKQNRGLRYKNNSGIKGLKDLGIQKIKNKIDRIPSIPKLAIPKLEFIYSSGSTISRLGLRRLLRSLPVLRSRSLRRFL